MKKIAIAAALSVFMVGSAFAQGSPNNGSSEMNADGSFMAGPCYNCTAMNNPPSDCVANDKREVCKGPGPYDARPYGNEHPGANGLNWQPDNFHQGGG